MMSEGILYRDECFKIQGAVFEVYREMGCGFLEAVYQECLEREMHARGIPFVAQQPLPILFKGEPLKQTYKPDFLCGGKIIVEIKALRDVSGEHRAQVHNYLNASRLRLGLLVNFGHYPKASVERIIL